MEIGVNADHQLCAIDNMGDGRLAPHALRLRVAHAHDAGHVLLRLDRALCKAGARRGPDAVVGLGILDAPAPSPVAGVARTSSLRALDVQ
eukprot:3356572-Lingulodinium_polyedra.AAC.1